MITKSSKRLRATEVLLTDQAGSQDIVLVASPKDGLYLFSDALSILATDLGAVLDYEVTYADPSGPRKCTSPLPAGSIGIIGTYGLLNWNGYESPNENNCPFVANVQAGTPFRIKIGVTGGTTFKYTYRAALVRL